MAKAEEGKIGFGGMPTDAEVRQLMERFGVPTEGEEISYDAITEVIGYGNNPNRWRTVVAAWRKRLFRDSNIIMRAGGGMFVVLDPAARVDHSISGMKAGARKVRRSERVIVRTERNRLDEGYKAKYDHAINSASAIRLALRSEAARMKTPRLPEEVKK